MIFQCWTENQHKDAGRQGHGTDKLVGKAQAERRYNRSVQVQRRYFELLKYVTISQIRLF